MKLLSFALKLIFLVSLKNCAGKKINEKSASTLKLLNYCCSIGSHLPECTNEGLKSVMSNPPRGLCRATMRLCCLQSLENDSIDCRNESNTFDVTSTCDVGCRLGRIISEKRVSCEIIAELTNVNETIKKTIKSCCDGKNRCSSGFKWSEVSRQCEDINECEIELNGCYEEQTCENSIGSYYCVPKGVCRKGFEFVWREGICKRVDEGAQSLTIFKEPSQKSEKVHGNLLSEDFFHDKSKIINFTNFSNNINHEMIFNYPPYLPSNAFSSSSDQKLLANRFGSLIQRVFDSSVADSAQSRVFECPNGFRVGGDGNTCEDIDECQENSALCQEEICTNLIGGFGCIQAGCPKGYSIHSQKKNNSRKCVRQPCSEGDCQLRPKYLLFKTLKLTEEKQKLSKEILVNVIRTKSFKFYVDFKINLAIKEKGVGVKKADLSDFGIKRQQNLAFVVLKNPLNGPQIILLKISLMKNEKVFEVHEINIFVN